MLRMRTAAGARMPGSAWRMRLASCWKRCASSAPMPRWWSCTLRLGPGQGRDPLEGGGIAVLVGHEQGGRPRGREQGGEHDARAGSRRQAETPPQAEDRVQHGPRGIGERPALDHRHRRADPATSPQETRAVRLVLRASHARSLHRHHVGGPDALLLVAAGQARGEEGVELRQRFGLHEEVGEGRMRGIRPRRREHELGIGGDVDLARLAAQIDERDPTDLGVVLGRDEHFEGAHDGCRRAGGSRPGPRGRSPGRSPPPPRRADDRPTTPPRSARRAGR